MPNSFNNPERQAPDNAITRLYDQLEGGSDKVEPGAEGEEDIFEEEPEEVEDEPTEAEEIEEEESDEPDEAEEVEEEEAEEEEPEDVEEDEEDEEEDEEDEEDEEELAYEKIKDATVNVGAKEMKVEDVIKSYQNLQREHTRVSQERSQLRQQLEGMEDTKKNATAFEEMQFTMQEIPEIRTALLQSMGKPEIQTKLQEVGKKWRERQAQNQPQQQVQQPAQQPQTQQSIQEPQQQEPQQQEPDPEMVKQVEEAIDEFKKIHGDQYDMQRIVETADRINAPVNYDGLKEAFAVAYADELLSNQNRSRQKTTSSKKKKKLKPKKASKKPAQPEPELDEGDEILEIARRYQSGPFG